MFDSWWAFALIWVPLIVVPDKSYLLPLCKKGLHKRVFSVNRDAPIGAAVGYDFFYIVCIALN
jgi:hypothetical protein